MSLEYCCNHLLGIFDYIIIQLGCVSKYMLMNMQRKYSNLYIICIINTFNLFVFIQKYRYQETFVKDIFFFSKRCFKYSVSKYFHICILYLDSLYIDVISNIYGIRRLSINIYFWSY